jgi:osmoprotectant transport system ATP-binding protein
MISLQDVSKTYDGGETYAVEKVNLEVAGGETMILLGSSGCGKTTTLKMINRLIEPSEGKILVDDRNILEHDVLELRRSVGYVFQGVGLFPHMTIEENIWIVPKLLGWPRKKRRDRARELLEWVELDADVMSRRYPRQLSGGQKQRIAVARALAADPEFLLMDEPFGALDALTRTNLQKAMQRIKEEVRKTIIFVTHDIFEALTLADRIAVMHEGHVEQVGTRHDILSNPASDFVKDLFVKPRKQLEDIPETEDPVADDSAPNQVSDQ